MKSTVRGADELVTKLQAMRKTHAKAAVRKGARAGAKIEQARAKDLVPVKSGALKKEIKVRAITRSRRWTGAQVTTKVKDGPTYYGAFVNYGTKKMKARRFLNLAAEQSKGAAGKAFADGIAAEIERRTK